MDDFAFIFLGALTLIFAVGFCLGLITLWRRLQSARWLRTRGNVEYFGVTYGVPSISYRYEVNGKTLSGVAISPSAFTNYPSSGARRSDYLDSAGRLKFPPGEEVEVFYNPDNPADAALVCGASTGLCLWLFFILMLTISPFFVAFHASVFSQYLWPFLATAWIGVLLLLLRWAVNWIARYQRSALFPEVPGRIIEAKIVYSQGDSESSGGYRPQVTFAYEVDGRSYRSSQQTVLNVYNLGAKGRAQAKLDALTSNPNVAVFYNPTAPWDSFLARGSAWGMAFPAVFLVVFSFIGIFILHHQ